MRMAAITVLCGGCMTMAAAGEAFAIDLRLTDGELDRITAHVSSGDVPHLSEAVALLNGDAPGVDPLKLLAVASGLTVPTPIDESGTVAERIDAETPLLDPVPSFLSESVSSLAALADAGGGATTSAPIVARGIDSRASTSFVPGVRATAQAFNYGRTTGPSGMVSLQGVSSSAVVIRN